MLSTRSVKAVVLGNAKKEMRARQSAIKRKQDRLLDVMGDSEDISNLSGDELIRRVRMRLKADQGFFEDFNLELSSLSAKQTAIVPWPVRTHKMLEILAGVCELFDDEETGYVRKLL
jgi:hypothetical protein